MEKTIDLFIMMFCLVFLLVLIPKIKGRDKIDKIINMIILSSLIVIFMVGLIWLNHISYEIS